ncbi:MAG: hypothetical protein JW759_09730 [Candidatus Coatesbacteria bacterium]|nr:hypothetical protein [Candidatus Coatesbacteria bacterium]
MTKHRSQAICLTTLFLVAHLTSCSQPPAVEQRLAALPLSSGTFDQVVRRGQDMTDPQFDAYLQARVIGKKVRWCREIRWVHKEVPPLEAHQAWQTSYGYSYDSSYSITVDVRHYGLLEVAQRCLQYVAGEGEGHTPAQDGLLDTCNQEVVFWLPLEKATSLPKEGGRICFEGVIGGVTRLFSTYTVDMGYLVQVVPQ